MANPIAVIRKIQEFEEVWGEFILNGPSTGLPGYVRDKYRERCNQFANLPGWAKALSRPVAGSLARACQPYWTDQGTDGPVAEPPFIGGQCAVPYRIILSVNNPTTGAPVPGSPFNVGTRTGPLVLTRNTPAPAVCNLPAVGRASREMGPVNGGQNPILLINQACSEFDQFGGVTVERIDGLADDCGNSPDEIVPGPNPPPDPGPLPGPEPTDDPDNPFGPPLFPIPPFIDPVFGPIPIVGDPDPPGAAGGGGAGGGDGLPGAADAIADSAGGTSGGADGTDVDFGEPPEGKIWVAALVQAVVDSRLGNIPGTGPAQTVYPTVIGNASLIYAGGRGTNERLESASSLLTRATTALVLTGCRVQAQPGVTLTVKPISAVTCPENPCEEQNG